MAKQKIEWITDTQAASMLHMTTKHFRKCVKSGKLRGKINYSELHRYATVFSKQDIENYIYENSTLAV